ncbi:MAG TPA: alpha/beta fold hydrolase [Synechococcales cyanobacterium M55_K2018_004]|nr:alpha/beta fold hydrolase [Synechococcales cyanobacterium M55_K2018_004]
MPTATTSSCQTQVGAQRDWVWRGWQVRYSYHRPTQAIAANSCPIVLLHGFGAALTQWHRNISVLGQHHPVYAVDLLGFGASEKASADFEVKLWAEQIRDFCQQVVGQPVVLVGHSLGALVALTLAVTYPDLVRGLILVTLPAARQELLPKPLQTLVGKIESFFSAPLFIKPIFHVARRPGFIRAALKQVYAQPELVTDELVESFVTPTADRGAAKVLCRLVKERTKNIFSASAHALLRHLDMPVLMLWGQQDRVIPIAWGRELARTYKHLKLVELSPAGHCPYDECPEQVNREILNWVETVVGGNGTGVQSETC